MSENDRLPGWPYFLAALFIVFAYRSARDLPDQNCQSTYYVAKSKINYNVEEECVGLIDVREKGGLDR